MKIKRARFVLLFCFAFVIVNEIAEGGVLKTLDQELSAIIEKAGQYLVTVRGNSGTRNLIATGVIFDSRGYVITSSQISEADSILVISRNGASYSATKVGVDNMTGLEILKIAGNNFTIPRWADVKKLSKGSLITVVGNSYEVPATLSFGGYQGMTDDGFVKLAVDVNPGASGSAVLDFDGALIGILVAREADNGARNGGASVRTSSMQPALSTFLSSLGTSGTLCYAVPTSMVQSILAQIVMEGKVRRGFLGISSQNLDSRTRAKLNISTGVTITGFDKGSPAEKAGLSKGDIITALGSDPVIDRASLYTLIRSRKPGDKVRIGLIRDSRRMAVDATLAQMEDRPFISGLELPPDAANLKVGNALDFVSNAPSATELSNLKAKIDELQKEVNELKKQQRR